MAAYTKPQQWKEEGQLCEHLSNNGMNMHHMHSSPGLIALLSLSILAPSALKNHASCSNSKPDNW